MKIVVGSSSSGVGGASSGCSDVEARLAVGDKPN